MNTIGGWLSWLVERLALLFKECFVWVWNLLKGAVEGLLDDNVDMSFLAWPDFSSLEPYLAGANQWVPIQEAWDLLVIYIGVWLVSVASRWILKLIGLITTGGW